MITILSTIALFVAPASPDEPGSLVNRVKQEAEISPALSAAMDAATNGKQAVVADAQTVAAMRLVANNPSLSDATEIRIASAQARAILALTPDIHRECWQELVLAARFQVGDLLTEQLLTADRAERVGRCVMATGLHIALVCQASGSDADSIVSVATASRRAVTSAVREATRRALYRVLWDDACTAVCNHCRRTMAEFNQLIRWLLQQAAASNHHAALGRTKQ